MFEVLQATSVAFPFGPLVTSTGDPVAGLTITALSFWVSQNNGLFDLKSHSAACVAETSAVGMYHCWLDPVDTATLGNLMVYMNYSGVLPIWREGKVVTSIDMYTHVVANQTSLASIAINVSSLVATNATQTTSLVSIATNITSIVATNATQTTSLVSIASNVTVGVASIVATQALHSTSLLSIATPVWSALRSAHKVTGSFGQLVSGGIPQSVAFTDLVFLMVDETDHRTPKTTLSVGGYVSKNAGSFASMAGTIQEISNGWYQLDASAADMEGATLAFRFTATGADDTGVTIKTNG